jgi:hypothetical protein
MGQNINILSYCFGTAYTPIQNLGGDNWRISYKAQPATLQSNIPMSLETNVTISFANDVNLNPVPIYQVNNATTDGQADFSGHGAGVYWVQQGFTQVLSPQQGFSVSSVFVVDGSGTLVAQTCQNGVILQGIDNTTLYLQSNFLYLSPMQPTAASFGYAWLIIDDDLGEVVFFTQGTNAQVPASLLQADVLSSGQPALSVVLIAAPSCPEANPYFTSDDINFYSVYTGLIGG